MSNRKFASVMFLLLTIIISLALSGLTFFINDKKASIINLMSGLIEIRLELDHMDDKN